MFRTMKYHYKCNKIEQRILILNTYASICTIRQVHTAMSLFVKKKNMMNR